MSVDSTANEIASLLALPGGWSGAKVLDCSPGSSHGLGAFCSSQGAQVTHLFASDESAKKFTASHGKDKNVCIRVGSSSSSLATDHNEFDVVIWLGSFVAPCSGSVGIASAQDGAAAYDAYCAWMRALYQAVKPEGFVVVDCAASLSALTDPGVKVSFQNGDGGSNGHKAFWNVSWLEDECVLRWSKADVNADSSALFTMAVGRKELASALIQEGGGFSQLHDLSLSTPFPGSIDGLATLTFAARKSSDLGHYERQLHRYMRVWNSNGRMGWGLCPGIPPLLSSYSTDVPTEYQGAMVSHNNDLFRWMVGKLPSDISSIIDVGCGMGPTLVDLAKHFGKGVQVAGCDPSKNCILSCQEKARRFDIQDQISLFTCTVEELDEEKKYDAMWSECALAHCTHASRQEALNAMASHLRVGGTLLLNDEHLGPVPASPKTQLHFFGRMHIGANLWTLPEYIEGLQKAGFEVSEVINLTPHVNPCYNALSRESLVAASEAEAAGNEEDRQTYMSMAVDYVESGKAATRGETLWTMFVCKKAQWSDQMRSSTN